jgi:hypothetical protein
MDVHCEIVVPSFTGSDGAQIQDADEPDEKDDLRDYASNFQRHRRYPQEMPTLVELSVGRNQDIPAFFVGSQVLAYV